MKYLVFTFLLFTNTLLFSQDVTAKQLLDKTIAYHDPNNTWSTFNGEFTVVMTTPNNSERTSKISINLPKEYFGVTATRDSVTTTYTINKGICEMRYNGKLLDSIQAKEKNLSCDRAQLYKNYYTYLYGLPMKIKDPGTILDEKVEKTSFHGEEFYKLRVDYEEEVGKDVWYFYFDTKDFLLRYYQFYHDLSKNDGEYILLSEEEVVQGIKMPKIRAWYMNNDDRYLGTDVLYFQK